MKDKYLRKLDIKLVDGEFENKVKGQLKSPERVHELFSSLKDKAQETLLGLFTDEKLNPRVYTVLSIGTNEHTDFDIAFTLRQVLLSGANTFVLVHNHPKGKPEPSDSDKEAILEIKDLSKRLKFVFLDFIIIGEDGYWSMFEEADGGEYSLGSVS